MRPRRDTARRAEPQFLQQRHHRLHLTSLKALAETPISSIRQETILHTSSLTRHIASSTPTYPSAAAGDGWNEVRSVCLSIDDKGLANQSYSQSQVAPNSIASMRRGPDEVETARQVLASQNLGSDAYFSALNVLANNLMSRFAHLGNLHDLDEGILRTKEVLDLAPPGHSFHAAALCNMGQVLSKRFKFRGGTNDLTEAVSCFEAAVASCTPENPSFPLFVGSLSSGLLNRYWTYGDVTDLDRIIETASTTLSSSPAQSQNQDPLLNNLATALKERFAKQGNEADLNAALTYYQSCLDLRPPGHPLRHSVLGNIAGAMSFRFEVDGHLQDLESAGNYYVSALQLRSPGQEGHSLYLNSLGSVYFRIFHADGKTERLEMAIGCYEAAMGYSKVPNLEHSRLLDNFAAALQSRYTLLGEISDLDQAIQYLTTSCDILPQTHVGRPITLLNLGLALVSRFKATSNIIDLDSSIKKLASALQLCTPGYHQHPIILSGYGNALSVRFREKGDMQDLALATSACKDALTLSSSKQPNYSLIVANLTAILLDCFCVSGNVEECQAVIDHCDSALVSARPGEPTFISLELRINRARAILYKAQYGREEKGVDSCINTLREIIPAIPEGHTKHVYILLQLGIALETRFLFNADEKDLNESIAFYRIAYRHCKRGNNHFAATRMQLGNALRKCFEYNYEPDTLDEAVVLLTEAEEILSLTPGQLDFKACAVNLSSALFLRFQSQRNRVDLETAIERASHVLTLPATPEKFLVAYNLAVFLSVRYSVENNLKDLERCIELFGIAAEQMPPKHHARGNMCRDYGDALVKLGYHHDQPQYSNSAMLLFVESIQCLPASHVDQPWTCIRFADALALRARANHLFNGDVISALKLLQVVVQILPEDSPILPTACYAAAQLCASKFAFSPQNPFIIEHCFRNYAKAARYTYTHSFMSVRAAIDWAKCAEKYQHSSTLLAYQTFLRSLNQHLLAMTSIKGRHVALVDKQWFRETSTLATDATACVIGLGDLRMAVELSEQGRGLLWSQLSQSQIPLDALRSASDAGRALASDFERVSAQLAAGIVAPENESYVNVTMSRLTIEQSTRRHRQLTKELEDIIARIRRQEGCQSFLDRPSFESLQGAAACGPVILVNVSKQRCDAIIVLQDASPRLVPLPEASLEGLSTLSARFYRMLKATSRVGEEKMREKEVAVVLRTLWDTVVRPIVDELTLLIPRGARIWWCPTSKLTTLPLHAAGPYRNLKGALNLPNIYVSSYTPTLTALIRARHRSSPASLSHTPPRFIAIGQAKPASSNGPVLQTVATELALVQSLLPSSPPSVPFSFCSLDGEASTADAALAALATHGWAHLACHGHPNVERPFDAAFALSNRVVTVLDIVRARGVGQIGRRGGVDTSMRPGKEKREAAEGEDPQPQATPSEECPSTLPGEFAFLSACHTAVGDEHAPDEIIHLAAAMQFVGFRSVIGTMWAVDDGMARHMVRAFYECMFPLSTRSGDGEGPREWDCTRAARALNKAAKLVDKGAVSLDQRVVFIHIGA